MRKIKKQYAKKLNSFLMKWQMCSLCMSDDITESAGNKIAAKKITYTEFEFQSS